MAIGTRWRDAIERAWWAPGNSALSWGLQPLAAGIRLAWHLRAFAYARGWRHPERAPVPLVVVGNLIVGGAGKTPCVIALAHALRTRGWSPGIVSRGHGANTTRPRPVATDSSAQEVGDEPLLMMRRADVPVWVGHDRSAVARALCAAHPGVDVLIADDGLQRLSLHRDAQLVVFDDRGIGNGCTLPAGPLREPMWHRVPERTVVVYNARQPSTPLPGPALTRRIGQLLSLKAWWAGDGHEALGLGDLAGQPIIAAAGIGHPARFFDMLAATGLSFERLPLPDHAPLDPRPWTPQAQRIIVTEKDAVKLSPDAPDADRIVVATLDLELPTDIVDALHHWLSQLPRA